ncbi:MAG TPA: tripartite tricarboxylate transporter substrate binding protein [Ramlibacter sp.]|nr:tripartite tricarboxylate transporter substrate binding protein [Ramlibacter sp.]
MTHKNPFLKRALNRLLIGVACCAVAFGAAAQEWPARPIRIVSPYAPGGVGDTIMRIIAGGVEARLGQRFLIDNRSGAAGNIGASAVVHAAPDGYTFLFAPTANYAVNQHLFKNLGFDPLRQLDPVIAVAQAPLIAITGKLSGATTLRELGAKSKAPGAKYSYGSPGAGSPTQLAGASFVLANGGEIPHVAYRGTPPLVQALLANDVQLAFPTLSPVLGNLQAGNLVALAVMDTKRLPELPNVPTALEAGYPGLLFSNWWVLAAPKGTDSKVTARLAAEIKTALTDPTVRAKLAELGHQPMDLALQDAADFIKAESARYKSLIDRTGIKLD